MTDRFKGNRPDPFLIIPYKLLRSAKFLNWVTKSEFGTWAYLFSYIIRADMEDNSVGTYIFENYYEKGLLAARWNQKQMAENMGKSRKSNSQISRHTKKLEAKGFIRKEYIPCDGKKTLVYVFGTRDFTSSKHEIITAFEYFYKEAKKERKERKEKKARRTNKSTESLDSLEISV